MSGPTIYGSDGKEQFTNANPAYVKNTQPIPSGDKHIGQVSIDQPLPAGTNVIGKTIQVNSSGSEPIISNGASNNDGSSATNNGIYTASFTQAFNGASWDRWRNNVEGVLLSSLSRTASAFSPTQTNHNAKGILLFLRVTTASGTGGLKIGLRGKDPVTGELFEMVIAPSAITATGQFMYAIYPSVGTVSGGKIVQSTSVPLPRSWDVYVTALDSSSYTYSLGYSLIL